MLRNKTVRSRLFGFLYLTALAVAMIGWSWILIAFNISIGNLTATKDVAAGISREGSTGQTVDENRLAANVASAMSKVRVQ
jgi:hypothetical protein